MTNIIKSKIKNVNNSKLKKSKLMSGGINDNIVIKDKELFTFQELFIKLNKKDELKVVLEGNEKIYNGLTIKKNKSLNEEQFINKCQEICNIPTGINESNETNEFTELTDQKSNNSTEPINIDNINKIATYFNLCFLIYIDKIEKIIKINENASTKILLCEKEDTYKFMKYGNYDSLVCLNMEDFSEEFNSKIIHGLNAGVEQLFLDRLTYGMGSIMFILLFLIGFFIELNFLKDFFQNNFAVNKFSYIAVFGLFLLVFSIQTFAFTLLLELLRHFKKEK